MGKSIQYDTEIIGAFPVIAEYLKKLGVASIVDELVPWEGNIPLGTLAEILILNRMLNPKAMVRVGEWAKKAGVTEYYGVTAEQLNDDLLGRALERLSKYRCEIETALVMVCIRKFGLDVAHVHFDITGVAASCQEWPCCLRFTPTPPLVATASAEAHPATHPTHRKRSSHHGAGTTP